MSYVISSYDCTSSEPPVMLLWDIRISDHMIEAVMHIGTKASVESLRRRKHLPSLEAVKARKDMQP